MTKISEVGLGGYNVSTTHDAAAPQELEAGTKVPDGNSEAHDRRRLWLWLLMSWRSRAKVEALSFVRDSSEREPANATGEFEIRLDELVQVVEGLSTLLNTDLERGIDDEIPQRTQGFGSNTYPGNTFWNFIWKAIKFPPSLVMLLAAVIISLLRIKGKAIHGGLYVEACVVLATVLDIIVRATTEYKQFRQEKRRNVDPEVTSVGINTECGSSMEFPHETDEEKPFQAYLKWITTSTSWVVVSFASVACIVQLGRYFSGSTKKSDGTPMFILGNTTADEATDYLIKSLNFWVATIVVAVPVGLPMAILLNLANTTNKMVTDNALVLTHSACERMGSVTTILCGKTGILTSDQDPCQPRSGTIAAIQLCRSGGVKVCMVTEDDVSTASAIAKNCGIQEDSPGHNIMTGAEFRALSDLDREEIAPKILVYAQSSPSDRLLLAEALKKGGNVFAAIGMGIHDPMSLHADVSIAMGSGENSNIIILDDDFATVIKIIQWCRSLHTNIQKYVLFRLTVSVSTLAICVIEVVFYDAFPFIAVQLLSLNLIVDIFGALALAYKPTGDHLMGKPAVGIRDPLITKTMWSRLIFQVIYVVLFLVLINYDKFLKLLHGDTGNGQKLKNTFIFNSFIFCLVFGEFEIRNVNQTFREILRENMFVVTITSNIVIQIIEFEFLGIFVSAVKIDWKKWLVSVVVGLLRFYS